MENTKQNQENNTASGQGGVIRRLFETLQKIEEETFVTALREMAVPPIKGEITKEKIKWRGIKIVQKQEVIGFKRWLEQRGKRISPVIYYSSNIDQYK